MTTLREHSRNAAADLIKALRVAPGDFDADSAAAFIEKALKTVTREQDSKARRALEKAQGSAEERLARLLTSSPAVIYSFKAAGDFAPIFVSDNIRSVF